MHHTALSQFPRGSDQSYWLRRAGCGRGPGPLCRGGSPGTHLPESSAAVGADYPCMAEIPHGRTTLAVGNCIQYGDRVSTVRHRLCATIWAYTFCSASMLDDAKRWFEAATTICRFVPDGESRAAKVRPSTAVGSALTPSLQISKTYAYLLERYTR